MSETLPEGSLLRVEMEIRLPIAASEDEVDEWLRFSLGANGSCASANPLIAHPSCPWGAFGSFEWEPIGSIGSREEYDHAPTESGGIRYKVRYRRSAALTSNVEGR